MMRGWEVVKSDEFLCYCFASTHSGTSLYNNRANEVNYKTEVRRILIPLNSCGVRSENLFTPYTADPPFSAS